MIMQGTNMAKPPEVRDWRKKDISKFPERMGLNEAKIRKKQGALPVDA